MEENNNSVIELAGITKKFRRGGGDFLALDSISISISKGEVFIITGRSGSGKTTLLNIIGGLETPTAGTVTVCGYDLCGMSDSALADYRRDRIGFVFQAFHLIEEKSALANVMLPLYLAGAKPKEAEEHALSHLERVGLGRIAREKVNTFSAGQKQRTALARSLVNSPEILIADEPTGNLDRENAKAVFDILCGNAAESGRTVLIATHDTTVLPDNIQNGIHIENGKIAHDKTAD